MNKLFTTIPAPKLKRNTFNLSNQVSLSMSFNKLYPSRLIEVIPGDVFSVNAEMFSRLMPMMAPVLNTMKLQVHAFYVPLRTMHKHFAEFMFNNKAGNYEDVLPYVTLDKLFAPLKEVITGGDYDTSAKFAAHYGSVKAGALLYLNYIALWWYLGIPISDLIFSETGGGLFDINALTDAQLFSRVQGLSDELNYSLASVRVNISPALAYEKVWNEYYRDENLIEDIFDTFNEALDDASSDSPELDRIASWMGDIGAAVFDNSDLSDAILNFFQFRPKAWSKDRFTTALPFAQRGPDVSIPIELDGSAPVKFDDSQNYGYLPTSKKAGLWRRNTSSYSGRARTELGGNLESPVDDANLLGVYVEGSSLSAGQDLSYDPGDTLKADLTSQDLEFTSTIRDFRRALRLQQWYENSARGGYRPNEATLAHFGVSVPDASLQRAEFLGGSSNVIAVSEVPQTSESGTTPQGTLAGKGTAYSSNHLFKHFFTEHGFIILMVSANCRANYYQGLDRMFSRMTRDEYAWPEFANLGEEPIYDKELMVIGQTTEDGVFGYTPRYSDYKSAYNRIMGDFSTSLKMWTQPREFANAPALNQKFIYDSAPLTPFAVQDGSDLILSIINFGVKASRLLPFYGSPTL